MVVPDGVLSRLNDKTLRDRILKDCGIDALISLPIHTFFATPKKTYILAITKKPDNTKTQDKPVFTYLVREIGETRDANRFETKDKNDLKEMAILFRQFMATPKDFKSPSQLCKIQEIERFQDKHWLIDRDWSAEEKKELGFEDDTIELSEKEFDVMIGDISKLLGEFNGSF